MTEIEKFINASTQDKELHRILEIEKRISCLVGADDVEIRKGNLVCKGHAKGVFGNELTIIVQDVDVK